MAGRRRKARSSTHFDKAIAVCPLAKGPFPPEARKCDWCSAPLTGKRRRWCKDACSEAAVKNHVFSVGRVAALRRDGWTCRECGVRQGRGIHIQVNHIKPCKGKHSMAHCSHHLANLELLCTECHKHETNRQRKAGEFR